MKTKLLSLLLVITLIIGMGTPAMAEGPGYKSGDPTTLYYFDTFGTLLYSIGVINKNANGSTTDFNDEATLTRAELSAILSRISLIEGFNFETFVPPTTPTFKDVPTTHWSYKYVEFLAATKISLGNGKGQFNPNGKVTLGEACLFLSRVWTDYDRKSLAENDMKYAVESYNEYTFEGVPIPSTQILLRKAMFKLILETLITHHNSAKVSLYTAKGYTYLGSKELADFSTAYSYAVPNMIAYPILVTKKDYPGLDKDKLAKFRKAVSTAKYTSINYPDASLSIESILKKYYITDTIVAKMNVYGTKYEHSDYEGIIFMRGNSPFINASAVFAEGDNGAMPVERGTGILTIYTFITSEKTKIYLVVANKYNYYINSAPYFVIFETADGKTGVFGQCADAYYEKDLANFK